VTNGYYEITVTFTSGVQSGNYGVAEICIYPGFANGTSGSSGTSGTSGGSGTSGVISCLNQGLYSTAGVTPISGTFVTGSSTVGNVGQPASLMRFNVDGYIGSTLVTQGFASYYDYLSGSSVKMIMINTTDPSEWVVFQKVSFSWNGTFYYTTTTPIVLTKSAGFTSWSVGDKYCIYVETQI
jgi:hypothetical protein